MHETARILIVDDEPANVELLKHVLEPAGFTNLVTTTDPRRVAELCAATPPDMVLLDLKLPHIDGFQLLEMLPDLVQDFEYLPVVVLTSDTSRESKALALSSGAKDFLNKPLSPTEVRLRVSNLLQTRFLQLALRDQNQILERRIRERTADLEEARFEVLDRLALAAEYRDEETGKHTKRVGTLTARLARDLGWPEEEVELILETFESGAATPEALAPASADIETNLEPEPALREAPDPGLEASLAAEAAMKGAGAGAEPARDAFFEEEPAPRTFEFAQEPQVEAVAIGQPGEGGKDHESRGLLAGQIAQPSLVLLLGRVGDEVAFEHETVHHPNRVVGPLFALQTTDEAVEPGGLRLLGAPLPGPVGLECHQDRNAVRLCEGLVHGLRVRRSRRVQEEGRR